MIINFLIFLIVNLWLSAQSSQPLERDIRTGNFSISSGAVYGQMGWEIAKDIVSDGNNIYVLVENSPRHYIIKYDMEGNIISTKTIGILGSESFTNLFITSNNIYIIGNDYSNSSKPGVIIIKQNKDLVLISSDTFYAGSNGLEFKSGVIDANYLYVCVDEVATIFAKQARLRKIDLTNLTVDSYNYYNFSSYSCGNYMFIRSGKLYTILKDSLYKTYISYSVLSNINTQTINELQIPFVPNSFYVATNSNFFVITQLTPDSETTIYKYDYTDFNSLNPLNVTKQINGQLRTATSTNSSLLLGYSRYNPVTNIEGYYIASLDPSSLDLINDVELYTQGNTTIRTIFPLYSVSGSTAYIVGVSYICKNWGCDNDVRTVRFYNFDVSMNKPPLLNFPISYRYSGGIEQGNVVALNQGVTFYIEYFDINNHDPEYVRLNIKHENENFYTNLNMTCISNCNSNRRLYALNNIFTIPGRYTYYFTAKESTTTEKYEAGGYPVENRLNFLVLKGFDGSFADNDNTIELKIPYSKNSEHKIFSFNQNLYALLNPNVGVRNNNTTERIDAPSIIVNLSTSPSMSNRFYDFNLNWPNTNSSNRLGWVIYDAEFNEKGNIEVIAASKTITDSYNIFFATVSPQIINNEISFNIV
ncbi:MAG: hypothetical protein N2749_01785, partial [Clostridia bacterium]|nr:hypothetical protein [Clostridia bacterium]